MSQKNKQYLKTGKLIQEKAKEMTINEARMFAANLVAAKPKLIPEFIWIRFIKKIITMGHPMIKK